MEITKINVVRFLKELIPQKDHLSSHALEVKRNMGIAEYIALMISIISAVLNGSLVWHLYWRYPQHCLKVSCQLSSFEEKEGIPEIIWSVINAGQTLEYIEEMIICIHSEDGEDVEKRLLAIDLTEKKAGTNVEDIELAPGKRKKFSESHSSNYHSSDMPTSFRLITGPIKYLAVRDGFQTLWKASIKNDIQKINQQMSDPGYHMKIYEKLMMKGVDEK